MKNEIFLDRLVTDVDLALQARHQSKSHQNESLHWTHSFAVKNRVTPESSLDDSKPQMEVKDLQIINILPSQEEQVTMQHGNTCVSCHLQIFAAYKMFSSAVVHHIPHQHSNEMKQKSEQVSNEDKCTSQYEFLEYLM